MYLTLCNCTVRSILVKGLVNRNNMMQQHSSFFSDGHGKVTPLPIELTTTVYNTHHSLHPHPVELPLVMLALVVTLKEKSFYLSD